METKSLTWQSKKDRELLVTILRQGDIAVGTSDTVIGLLAAAIPQAREKLDRIKQRTEKPYIILVGSVDKLAHYVELPRSLPVETIIQQCWPGPLTLIFKARKENILLQPTIAIRIPAHQGLLEVLQQFDGLLSTSANISGHSTPTTIQDVDAQVLRQVACIITDEQAQHNPLPSTIVDCTGDQLRLVREGAFKVADLERSAGTTFKKS